VIISKSIFLGVLVKHLSNVQRSALNARELFIFLKYIICLYKVPLTDYSDLIGIFPTFNIWDKMEGLAQVQGGSQKSRRLKSSNRWMR
jgi:hypothetical protein